MASAVTAPLERQFGQVPGLKQMTSTSSDGSSVITLQFALDLDIDVAEQEVQAADQRRGEPSCRATCRTRRSTARPTPPTRPILTLALTSETLPLSKVEDLADTRLAQKISQLPGVGLVSISGGQKPAVRIQVESRRRSPRYGLSLEDVRTAIAAGQRQPGQGQLRRRAAGVSPSAPTTSSFERRSTGQLIIAYRNGAPVRLSDVADVVDGAENVRQARLDERRRPR